MYIETPTNAIESKKGILQPQSAKFSAPTIFLVNTITPNDKNNPPVAVVCIQLVKKPRLLAGACSATYVAAPPYSPPRASPCTNLRISTRIGAAYPILE
ncbi:hypothetical protein D3C80_1334990 [compost metagenome]